MKSSPSSATATWHQLETTEVVQLLKSDCQRGLSGAEVTRRQQQYGLNIVSARGGTPAWKRFLQQFNQPLVYLLVAASVITAFLHEWVDSGVIFGVVLVNAIIGFI
ncbi:MAG TPA: carbonate dehydratase, partial [Verrucomicrobiales bacterium]|nr:carbonate dehydratase [Verrucomicrobiales bacterium]